MVRASTIIVAAFALAPVFAAPLTEEITQDLAARSIEETPVELDARKFKLGKAFKKLKGIAKMAVNVAAPGAGALIPREFEEDVTDIEAREPEPAVTHPHAPGQVHPSSHAHARGQAPAHRGVGHHAKGGPKHPHAKGQKGSKSKKHGKSKGHKKSKSGRKGPKGKGAKGKGSKGRKGSLTHGKHAAHAGLRTAKPRPRSLDEFVDEESIIARDLDIESTLADLVERGYIEVVEDVDSREPKIKLGNFFKKVKGVASKVSSVAAKVHGVGSALGLRDLEDDEVEARDIAEDGEVEARDIAEDIEDLDARFDFEESSLDQLD